MHHVLPSPPTSVAGAAPLASHEAKESTTKDVGEDVVHPSPSATSFSQALLPIAVVELLLLWVGQHLVGKADFFELIACIGVLVWVVLFCQFPISLESTKHGRKGKQIEKKTTLYY